MNKVVTKVNNDPYLFGLKVKLRLESLPSKSEVTVLDCFGGEGMLWKSVKSLSDKNIKVLSIDKAEYQKVNLKGDNLKFIKDMDLSYFDIIDLDSYGSPSNQLELISNKNYKGIIHCTFIQTMMGGVNHNILFSLGYTRKMIKKCPTLFNKNGIDKLLLFVKLKFNVDKVRIVTYYNKNYFYFVVNQ